MRTPTENTWAFNAAKGSVPGDGLLDPDVLSHQEKLLAEEISELASALMLYKTLLIDRYSPPLEDSYVITSQLYNYLQICTKNNSSKLPNVLKIFSTAVDHKQNRIPLDIVLEACITEIRDGVADCRVIQDGLAFLLDFDSDRDYKLVTENNMSKLVISDQVIKATVDKYKEEGVTVVVHDTGIPVENTTYKAILAADNAKYPKGKLLKPAGFQSVDLGSPKPVSNYG